MLVIQFTGGEGEAQRNADTSLGSLAGMGDSQCSQGACYLQEPLSSSAGAGYGHSKVKCIHEASFPGSHPALGADSRNTHGRGLRPV